MRNHLTTNEKLYSMLLDDPFIRGRYFNCTGDIVKPKNFKTVQKTVVGTD